MIQKGTCFRTQTKTQDDVFGTCIWKVIEDGLPTPTKDINNTGRNDGVKCLLVGGSGPAARRGFTVIDSVYSIMRDIESKVTELISEEEANSLEDHYNDPDKSKRVGSGIEVDL